MFSALLERLAADFEALKRTICAHDAVRAVLFGDPATLNANPFLMAMTSTCPKKLQWQVIDHCAAITRLYALYEQFIEAVVTSHIDLLPTVYPQYTTLPECVRKQHRVGAGQILQKWSATSIYNHLTEPVITAGLVDGLRGLPQYRLLSDAFLTDVENYRPSALRKLFGYIDFADCVAYLHKHPTTVDFIKAEFGNADTLDGILGQIVQLRNEAAHGNVASVLSSTELCRYVEFVFVVCRVLAEMVERRSLNLRITSGHCEELGTVIHRFSDSIVGIQSEAAEWRKGEKVAAKTPTSAKAVEICSIEVNRSAVTDVTAQAGQQIGIKLSEPLSVGTKLYRIVPPGAPAPISPSS
jgi:hypothetical protein